MDGDKLVKYRSVARCIADGFFLFRAQMWGVLKKVWVWLLAASVAFAVMLQLMLKGELAWGLAFLPVFIVAYCLFKRAVVRQLSPLPKIGNAFRRAFRHLGQYVWYSCLSGIIRIILFAILFLPVAILLMAGFVEAAGVKMGDETVLGVGFSVLMFVTFIVCFALVLFAQIWQIFGLVYLYGAMKAHDEALKLRESGL